LLGKVNACIDLSDGLYLDATRLATASNVGIVLEADAIPVANGARLDQALASGEEYELLFCASPRQAPAVRRAARRGGVFVTRIGSVERGHGVEIVGVQDVALSGFDHFANSSGSVKV
jgi:thiamine-monophosphate kinase